MDDNATTFKMLFEKAEDYIKTSAELLKLQAIDKSADVMSSLVASLAIGLVVVLSLFLASFGLALAIGEELGNVYYGFFIVAGGYLIVALLLHIFKINCIKIPISNYFIKKIMQKKVL